MDAPVKKQRMPKALQPLAEAATPAQPKVKRVRAPKAVAPTPDPGLSSVDSLQPTEPTESTEPLAPVGCQAIIGSGDMAGKFCGCKVKAPSTDRCGRHINTKVKSEVKENGEVAPKKRAAGKTAQNKDAQLRQAIAKHNAQWTTFISVNAFGRAVYPGTDIVLDQTKDVAVGVQLKDGTIRPLTVDEIQFCAQKFIPFHAIPVLLTGETTEEDSKASTAFTQIRETIEPGVDDTDPEDDESDEEKDENELVDEEDS